MEAVAAAQAESKSEPGAVELVENIVNAAMRTGASDIHLDPCGDAARVSFRLHGRLVTARELTGGEDLVPRSALQRIKVLAKIALGDGVPESRARKEDA